MIENPFSPLTWIETVSFQWIYSTERLLFILFLISEVHFFNAFRWLRSTRSPPLEWRRSRCLAHQSSFGPSENGPFCFGIVGFTRWTFSKIDILKNCVFFFRCESKETWAKLTMWKNRTIHGKQKRFKVVVSTHLKNISQIGPFPQIGMKINKYLKPPPRIWSSTSPIRWGSHSAA